MFGVGLGLPCLAGLLFLTMPDSLYDPPSVGPVEVLVPLAALVGIGVGVLWMWRILKANPEPDTSAWRYRER